MAPRSHGRRSKRRDAEPGRELERLIDAIARGADLAALVPRVNALKKERDEVRTAIAAIAQAVSSDQPVTLHPAALDRFTADITQLADLRTAGGRRTC